jgi:hypothetical protein
MHYIASKVYAGRDDKGDPLLRAKGFGLGKLVKSADKKREVYSADSFKRYADAVGGIPIHSKQMVRAKEYMMYMGAEALGKHRLSGAPLPIDKSVDKAITLLLRPKRAPIDGTNETRPWTIEELTCGVPYTPSPLEIARRAYVVQALRAHVNHYQRLESGDNALSSVLSPKKEQVYLWEAVQA